MFDNPKLLVLGYGEHGKDTVAELLRDDYGFKFTSSSMFVAQECLWNHWGCAKYPNFEAMYEDRRNHRVLWMEMISAYNTPDKTKTAATMLERGFDMYVGMRRLDELRACQQAGVFDFIIWVDAEERLGTVETGSMDITKDNSHADFIIDNNGSLEDLPDQVSRVLKLINSRRGIPEHPWDSMTPLETLADWLGTDTDDLLSMGKEPEVFGIPVRAAPPVEVLTEALQSINSVLWHDPLDNVMVMRRAQTLQEALSDAFGEQDVPDPWGPALEFLSQFEAPEADDEEVEQITFHFITSAEQAADDWVRKLFMPDEESPWVNLFLDDFGGFEDGGPVEADPAPVGANGPEFISRRSKVGQLEEHTTTAQGVTTIVNIENVYIVGDTDE